MGEVADRAEKLLHQFKPEEFIPTSNPPLVRLALAIPPEAPENWNPQDNLPLANYNQSYQLVQEALEQSDYPQEVADLVEEGYVGLVKDALNPLPSTLKEAIEEAADLITSAITLPEID